MTYYGPVHGARSDARKRRQQPEQQDRLTDRVSALLAELDAHALNLWRAADGEGLTPAAVMAAVAAADQASRLAERIRMEFVVRGDVDQEDRAEAWEAYCSALGWRPPWGAAHAFLAGYDTARRHANTTTDQGARP